MCIPNKDTEAYRVYIFILKLGLQPNYNPQSSGVSGSVSELSEATLSIHLFHTNRYIKWIRISLRISLLSRPFYFMFSLLNNSQNQCDTCHLLTFPKPKSAFPNQVIYPKIRKSVFFSASLGTIDLISYFLTFDHFSTFYHNLMLSVIWLGFVYF